MGKNQHYVPQFYLRLFSNDSKSIGTWITREDKIITHASISNMASRNNLYGSDQILENELSKVEKDWSTTINRILKTNQIATLKEKASILTFITIGATRTLKRAEEENHIANYFAKLMLSRKLTKKELNNLRVEMNIPNLKPMQYAADATQMLFDLKSIVLDNCSTINFVTSDNPICKYNKLYITRKYDRNYGWGSAGLIILLPLSPKKCLCLYDSNVYSCESQNSIILKSSSKVTQINKLLTRNSYYNIFFDNSQPLSYINNIKKSYQYVPIENCLKEHFNGQLIQINQCSILENYSLDFLTIKPLYKTIELPLHMAGLIRPIAKKYIQQNPERFFEKT